MRNIIAAAVLGGSLIIAALIVAMPKAAEPVAPAVMTSAAQSYEDWQKQYNPRYNCPEGQVWVEDGMASNTWGDRCDWPTVHVEGGSGSWNDGPSKGDQLHKAAEDAYAACIADPKAACGPPMPKP